MDVQPIRHVENLRIVIGRADEGDDVPAAPHREAVHVAILHRGAEIRLYRGVETQQLLHCRRGSGSAPPAGPPVDPVTQQRQQPVAEQVGGGFVAGHQEQAQHHQHLVLGQGVAGLLRMHQGR